MFLYQVVFVYQIITKMLLKFLTETFSKKLFFKCQNYSKADVITKPFHDWRQSYFAKNMRFENQKITSHDQLTDSNLVILMQNPKCETRTAEDFDRCRSHCRYSCFD